MFAVLMGGRLRLFATAVFIEFVQLESRIACQSISNLQGKQISISFSGELDTAAVNDLANWQIEQWNYRWSEQYGSDHYSVKNPERIGHDVVTATSAKLNDDGKTTVLSFEELQPVMQMNIRASLKTRDGQPVQIDLYNTINEPGK